MISNPSSGQEIERESRVFTEGLHRQHRENTHLSIQEKMDVNQSWEETTTVHTPLKCLVSLGLQNQIWLKSSSRGRSTNQEKTWMNWWRGGGERAFLSFTALTALTAEDGGRVSIEVSFTPTFYSLLPTCFTTTCRPLVFHDKNIFLSMPTSFYLKKYVIHLFNINRRTKIFPDDEWVVKNTKELSRKKENYQNKCRLRSIEAIS